MKIKAVRKNKWYKNQDYITLGKEYEAIYSSEDYAEFCDDVGDLVYVIFENSAHGFDFEVVQEEDQQKPFKFKVGDKVKVTGGQHIGTEGTLIKHRFEEYPWFELEGTGLGVAVDNLALLQSVDPMPIVEPEEDLMETDNVNNPSHYGTGSIECIDYIKDFLTNEEYVGYLRGNVAKYLHRFRYKNGLEDLKKAEWYLKELIEAYEDRR